MSYRMIPLESRDGITNTALDRVFQETDEPVVVFSRWENPTLSISYKQNLHRDVDVDRAKEMGADIVRRRSGGRTVYLDDDYLGFTVAEPYEGIEEADTTNSYRKWCNRVAEGLGEAGIDAHVEGNDILVGKRKIGNAAMRLWADKKYMLVHGSIRERLTNLKDMLSVLRLDGESMLPYENEAREVVTSVADEGGDELYPRLVDNLCPDHYEDSLTPEEEERLEEFRAHYSDWEWTKGNGDEPSRGPCDFIFGDELKIPSLREKVEREELSFK